MMRSLFSRIREVLISLVALFIASTISVFAATTVGTDLSTDGTFTVTGVSSVQGITFVSATGTAATTTAFAFTSASGTTLNAINLTSSNVTITGGSISLGGSSVCLANGTNCPSSSAPTLSGVTAVAGGSSATTTLQFYGGFLSASSTVTSTLDVAGGLTFTVATASRDFDVTGTFGAGTSTFLTGVSTTNLLVSRSLLTLDQANAVLLGIGATGTGFYLGGSANLSLSVNGIQRVQWVSGGAMTIAAGTLQPASGGSQSLGIQGAPWGGAVVTSTLAYQNATGSNLFALNVSSTTLQVNGTATSSFFGAVSTTNIMLSNVTAASAGRNPLCREANGYITEGAAGICPTSALEIKKDIKPISYGLKEILKTDFVDYRFKDEDGMVHSGVIADWTDKYMPQLTLRDAKGKIIGFDQFSFLGVLGQAIKDQQKQIEDLKQQVKLLQQQLGR